MASGWLMGGVKSIPARKNNVYSLEVRNRGVYGELNVIPFVWSIRCGIGTWSRWDLRYRLGTDQGEP